MSDHAPLASPEQDFEEPHDWALLNEQGHLSFNQSDIPYIDEEEEPEYQDTYL